MKRFLFLLLYSVPFLLQAQSTAADSLESAFGTYVSRINNGAPAQAFSFFSKGSALYYDSLLWHTLHSDSTGLTRLPTLSAYSILNSRFSIPADSLRKAGTGAAYFALSQHGKTFRGQDSIAIRKIVIHGDSADASIYLTYRGLDMIPVHFVRENRTWKYDVAASVQTHDYPSMEQLHYYAENRMPRTVKGLIEPKMVFLPVDQRH